MSHITHGYPNLPLWDTAAYALKYEVVMLVKQKEGVGIMTEVPRVFAMHSISFTYSEGFFVFCFCFCFVFYLPSSSSSSLPLGALRSSLPLLFARSRIIHPSKLIPLCIIRIKINH